MSVSQLQSWQALKATAAKLHDTRIERMFELEPNRLDYLCLESAGIFVDMSKTLLDRSALDGLLWLAKERHVSREIAAMFNGDVVNRTENRAALHTLLRAPRSPSNDHDSAERFNQVIATRRQMEIFSDRMANSEIVGFSGSPIRDVVNIGIGGSHLGPQLVCEALRHDRHTGPNVHFVSNADGGNLDNVLAPLDPETTYFVVASKSFNTAETLLNAKSAKSWIAKRFSDAQATRSHFAAVTSKPERAVAFGVEHDNIFPMWDWVGGRYSLWSAIGLPISIAIGSAGFRRLLAGAHAMDQHFRTAELTNNIPVLLALVGIWNNNFLGCNTHAVIPYDDRLQRLPEYLQQLEMESNGKQTTLKNNIADYSTVPVLWGGVGTNAQHAFFQQMHQGTRNTSTDFILALTHQRSSAEHHDMLVANCLAQAASLMCGRSRSVLDDIENPTADIDLPSHRETPGNRPSTMIVVDSLTPESLGSLLALFEHKTYVQGVIWDINPFDQWGVELGKHLADSIIGELHGENAGSHDPSTKALIARYSKMRDAKS